MCKTISNFNIILLVSDLNPCTVINKVKKLLEKLIMVKGDDEISKR